MILKSFKIFLIFTLLIFISCEDRLFVEREPELFLDNNVYKFDSAEFTYDHVVLVKDTVMYAAFPCNDGNVITFFNIEQEGTYLMSVILDKDTLFRKPVYLNEIHNNLTEITVLDVNQGDSFIISPIDEKPSIIDGGYGTIGYYDWMDGGDPTLLNHLANTGISDLKYIIQTHADADHYGGLNDVISDGSIAYDQYFTNNSIELPAINDTLFFSEDVYGIMLHYGDLPDSVETEENNRSITLKLVFKDFEMLFTADIEEEVEEYLLRQSYFNKDSSYDILKVPHHGSSSSSSEELLEHVQPKLSVISCGEGNPWSHPTEEVQYRLECNSNSILRTDMNGTIRIFSDGLSIQTISR